MENKCYFCDFFKIVNCLIKYPSNIGINFFLALIGRCGFFKFYWWNLVPNSKWTLIKRAFHECYKKCFGCKKQNQRKIVKNCKFQRWIGNNSLNNGSICTLGEIFFSLFHTICDFVFQFGLIMFMCYKKTNVPYAYIPVNIRCSNTVYCFLTSP